MAYKDVVREQVLEDMAGGGAAAAGGAAPRSSKLAYDGEQEELRKAFLDGADGSGSEDELLERKGGGKGEEEEHGRR